MTHGESCKGDMSGQDYCWSCGAISRPLTQKEMHLVGRAQRLTWQELEQVQALADSFVLPRERAAHKRALGL